eukprot:5162414-Amphidinium_carterae.1
MNGVLSSGRASCSVRGVEAVQMLVGDHLAGVSNTTGTDGNSPLSDYPLRHLSVPQNKFNDLRLLEV